jgi:4-diphosphocytidyl-2-C-methyl-D-erythritol kinase
MKNAALPAIRVRAHAKINLNLRVLARREDGYHDLRTVFQALALHDSLTFVARPGPFDLQSSDVHLPADSTNLVWRAAELLWRHLRRDGPPRDVAVRLDKRIPMKAGLGGGSADAAAALLGFARLWDPQLAPADLAALGRQLGADVPFFFTGGAALGLGRGDEIYPLVDLPRLGVLLVVPRFDVSTADAYRWLDEERAEGRVGQVGHRSMIPACTWPFPACEIANDFEPVVAARHPEIAEIVRALEASGAAAASMTGSGSAVFGLFDKDEVLANAARSLECPGCSTWRTRTLSRREYLRASTPALSANGRVV